MTEDSVEIAEDIAADERDRVSIRYYSVTHSREKTITSCEGDLIVICNVLADYEDLLDELLQIDGERLDVRVSTWEQNPERQIHILRDEEGIDERDIYVEKESGRQFERPVYRSLVDNILREGDLLVVTELKRFGRNYSEIYKEWFHITKEIGADIKVTSMPILDTTQSKELVGQLITDVVLAVFAYVADEDWTERHELQRQGIEAAKANGKHLGRPRVEFPENWEDCYGRWKSSIISAKEAMTLTGLKKDSFYRLVKRYESERKDADGEKE